LRDQQDNAAESQSRAVQSVGDAYAASIQGGVNPQKILPYAILGGVAVAVHMLVVKLNVTRIHPNILVFYRVSLAALVIAVWAVMNGKLNLRISTPHLCVTLLGAFLGPCASFLLTFRSYRYWELSRSSIVLTAQPLLVLPMAFIAFGKIPTGLELLGGFVILGGAFSLMWLHRAQIIQ
jgi:drug/metabolite transporter (DMT)-like permease